MSEKPKNIENMLPHGEFLRTFLNQPFVSKGELKSLLRSRGVFTFSGEKIDTIPVITNMILSPSEFDDLVECHRTREDTQKLITQYASWESNENLLESLPEKFSIRDFSDNIPSNYEIEGNPSFYPIAGNPEHVRVDYKIRRTDHTKSWSSAETIFSGSVEVKKIMEKGKVKLSISHTAKETKSLGNKICSGLVKDFKERNYIPKESDVKKVHFDSFSNEDRIQFFLELSVENTSNILSFIEIIDLELSPDQSQTLPKKMDWMSNKIDDLKLNGKSLHETFFVQEKDNHKYILLYKVDVKYAFEDGPDAGECIITLQFPEYSRAKDYKSELEITIKNPKFNKNISRATKSEVSRKLLEEIEEQKFEKYLDYSENKND